MFRGLIAPFIAFAIIGFIGFGIVYYQTNSTAVLDQQLIDSATASGGGDDALLQDSDAELLSPEDPSASRMEIYLEDVFRGLRTWLSYSMLAGLAFSLAFSLMALGRQRQVCGPQGQSSARPIWWTLFALYGVTLFAIYFWLVEPLGLPSLMNDFYFYGLIVGVGILGVIGYWAATVFAASPVMRPSVPAAAR